MKLIILSLSYFLFTSTIIAQDTIYYDDSWQELSLEELQTTDRISYYKVIDTEEQSPAAAMVRTYWKSGAIYSETPFVSYEDRIIHGKSTSWFKEGNLKFEGHFYEGQRHGSLVTYWENGQKKRRDMYRLGELKEGICWNAEGEEVEYFDYHIKPEFPGGIKELARYIKDNVKYQKDLLKKGEFQRVIVEFNIGTDGYTKDIRIKKGDERFRLPAYMVVKEMPQWSPGYIDGEVVTVHYALPLVFKG